MIAALQGTIFASIQNPLTLMTGGVGYAVHVPEKILTHVGIGDTIILYTHTYVREDAIELYGFETREELFLFQLLLAVSGIGPRTSLLVVNRGVNETEHAISVADVDFFTDIPRLGKKNAQKIIIELKSKLGSIRDLDLQSDNDGETKQVSDALTGMGFAKKRNSWGTETVNGR